VSNYDTEKAITDNLSAIITTALAMKQEDASGGQGTAVQPLCTLLYRNVRFEDLFTERMSYNEIGFNLVVSFKDQSIGQARDRMQYWVDRIRHAITRQFLNVGDLAVSKLVTWVRHEGADTDYDDAPLAVINYPITVRYRET